MSIRRSAADLARGLERHGLVFRSFVVSSEGEWAAEDADWNYKDVPHLNEVHSLASTVPAAIDDEVIATVNIQRIGGLPMPIALANYVAPDGSQVYYTTLFAFVLVVETRIIDTTPVGADAAPCRARVETTYRIGGPKVLMWFFPVLRRLLTANYHVLMSEDLPMREQRGRLRRAGYRFKSDGRPRTFAETVDLTVTNVIAPEPDLEHKSLIDLGPLTESGATVVVGHGSAGVRLVRGVGSEILVFDRVCSHEGACLDSARLAGSSLVCPWHAKRIKPLETFRTDDPEPRQIRLQSGVLMEVEGTRCSFRGIR
jgi:nitrite reductase/ring-hydroxylating ferredoxin subunit